MGCVQPCASPPNKNAETCAPHLTKFWASLIEIQARAFLAPAFQEKAYFDAGLLLRIAFPHTDFVDQLSTEQAIAVFPVFIRLDFPVCTHDLRALAASRVASVQPHELMPAIAGARLTGASAECLKMSTGAITSELDPPRTRASASDLCLCFLRVLASGVGRSKVLPGDFVGPTPGVHRTHFMATITCVQWKALRVGYGIASTCAVKGKCHPRIGRIITALEHQAK